MKNSSFAAVLSFLVIGLGQIYNGQVKKGLLLMGLAALSAIAALFLIGIVTSPILWIWNIYDAYKTAEKINQGNIQQNP